MLKLLINIFIAAIWLTIFISQGWITVEDGKTIMGHSDRQIVMFLIVFMVAVLSQIVIRIIDIALIIPYILTLGLLGFVFSALAGACALWLFDGAFNLYSIWPAFFSFKGLLMSFCFGVLRLP